MSRTPTLGSPLYFSFQQRKVWERGYHDSSHTESLSSLPQVEALQFDFLDRDSNAFPETVGGVRESHGTSVAGEVAMEKGNDVCGVGVAYNSFITGLCVWYAHQTLVLV